ncbi:hypothetical protein AMTRI_Chr08g209950 [Amborella trichopoda]
MRLNMTSEFVQFAPTNGAISVFGGFIRRGGCKKECSTCYLNKNVGSLDSKSDFSWKRSGKALSTSVEEFNNKKCVRSIVKAASDHGSWYEEANSSKYSFFEGNDRIRRKTFGSLNGIVYKRLMEKEGENYETDFPDHNIWASSVVDPMNDRVENSRANPSMESKRKEKFLGEKLNVHGETVSKRDKDDPSSSIDFLTSKEDMENIERKITQRPENIEGSDFEASNAISKRQVLKRSAMLAKQVISIQCALTLGYVSQLWVDTTSWTVVMVEVRPSLLSGDIGRFLLKDVYQVGDVVLVEDVSVLENEPKMIGLDTLVGYNVITDDGRNVGKVRGYSFDINTGAVESLELDSFGISIIPASLVSTYSLFVIDVLEVTMETVIVHDGVFSRVQRLTKGIWETRNIDMAGGRRRENYDYEPGSPRKGTRKRSGGRRNSPKNREIEQEWELPMDY